MTARTTFSQRHIGPNEVDELGMLATVGVADMAALIQAAMPGVIRTDRPLELPGPLGEDEMLHLLRQIMGRNDVVRSYIGCGYHGCVTPPVIRRNILENPRWYTQYTPYQAEISQGRLEMLLNFQTMIADLAGLPIANASLLDEATASAEAMAMCLRLRNRKSTANLFVVEDSCHPQTIAIVKTRAKALKINVQVVAPGADVPDGTFGWLAQYPDTYGVARPLAELANRVHAAGALLAVAADPLALVLLEAPGAAGADIVVGSSQRFGVPMGYGGPHAAYLATRDAYKRQIPGRMIGVSIDATGKPALRMALQTREQHIRRNRATSNICTAQVLLAVIAAAYGCYHGPDGLTVIATRVRRLTTGFAAGIKKAGWNVADGAVFDTVTASGTPEKAAAVVASALAAGMNLRDFGAGRIGVSFDETSSVDELQTLLTCFGAEPIAWTDGSRPAPSPVLPAGVVRTTEFMTHEVFHSYRSETEMLRYLNRLASRDLSLADAMIPLGSCTMKLNAAAEMLPITWPEVAAMHPFAPLDQAAGHHQLFAALESYLAELTGFSAVSLQPNAGAQGEYAGLLAIRAWHDSRGDTERDVCLIPTSAHGTNPASAVMAGMRVVSVRCDDKGNIDLADLRKRAQRYSDQLAALMVTYPSTHGVFEEGIRDICATVHEFGGQVYMDGANLNALLGYCRPAELGADVAHLNLHKTFCIPHGGGGPGVGPIGVADHLAPFLPGHPFLAGSPFQRGGDPVSAAPWGSPCILPISWAYVVMMGPGGLTAATASAILNANYIVKRLAGHYDVLYTGPGGFVAHECIIDVRPFKKSAGVSVDDIAKRLIDYGFHAPTMSWPVAGTLMIEPTESESRAEIDRFCDAMIAIRAEIARVEKGDWPRDDNPLVHSPHTVDVIGADEWSHAYTRAEAAWPVPSLRTHKFWSSVSRVDNAYGDRNLVCSCVSVADVAEPDTTADLPA